MLDQLLLCLATILACKLWVINVLDIMQKALVDTRYFSEVAQVLLAVFWLVPCLSSVEIQAVVLGQIGEVPTSRVVRAAAAFAPSDTDVVSLLCGRSYRYGYMRQCGSPGLGGSSLCQ